MYVCMYICSYVLVLVLIVHFKKSLYTSLSFKQMKIGIASVYGHTNSKRTRECKRASRMAETAEQGCA